MASTDSGVAETILQQLGGGKFLVMTGAKPILKSDKSLTFSLPRDKDYVKDGINRFSVTLEQNDTYKLEFFRMTRVGGLPTAKLVKERDQVYVDNLRQIFTLYTGLDTSLRG